MNSKSSFTKKEVVVVLGCVFFVLANLGAVRGTGRRRAREAVCLSNLYKWGVIWKSYADDHDGFLGDREAMRSWMYIAEPYYKNRKMLLCPEATRLFAEGARCPFGAWSTNPDGGLAFNGSYCVNLWVSTGSVGRDPARFWRTPYVSDAAYAPLLLDGNWRDAEPWAYDEASPYDGFCWEPNQNEMKRVCINRHRGAVNSAFLDLSARKLGLKQLWKLKWYRDWPSDAGPASGWPEWMGNLKDY